jgi:hypothetical protein
LIAYIAKVKKRNDKNARQDFFERVGKTFFLKKYDYQLQATLQ